MSFPSQAFAVSGAAVTTKPDETPVTTLQFEHEEISFSEVGEQIVGTDLLFYRGTVFSRENMEILKEVFSRLTIGSEKSKKTYDEIASCFLWTVSLDKILSKSESKTIISKILTDFGYIQRSDKTFSLIIECSGETVVFCKVKHETLPTTFDKVAADIFEVVNGVEWVNSLREKYQKTRQLQLQDHLLRSVMRKPQTDVQQ
jgi:hypothetical protein